MALPTSTQFYAELCELIKTQRIKNRISQEQLGTVLNLSRASIINLEKGRHKPSVYQLLCMADLFQVELMQLIPNHKHENAGAAATNAGLIENAVIDKGEIDSTTKTVLDQFLAEL